MSKTAIILFSGFNMRALYAFMRTLEKDTIPYYIIASSNDDEIFQTYYKSKVVTTREYKALDLKDIINSIETLQHTIQAEDYFIAPSTEALNRFLLEHRSIFEDLKCTIPLVEKKLYELISDKYSFGVMCKKYNITIPKEYNDLNQDNLPLVAKPKKYFGSNGNTYTPQIITNVKEMESFYSKYKRDDFYFQEYIDGRCVYLLFYFDKNQKAYKFSQENLIQQENGKSMLLATSSLFHNDDISSRFEDLFSGMGFRGLVMIELKLMDGKFIMIEANPRFWGPSQLFVDAGINFFNYLLKDYSILQKGNIANSKSSQKTMYFWDDGISKNIDNRKELAFYNYTRKDFEQDKSELSKIEIYNRDDTKDFQKGNRWIVK